jgi:UDP-3-O-[3-hydroxymyristoyl] glucosamine N-acyltransferase
MINWALLKDQFSVDSCLGGDFPAENWKINGIVTKEHLFDSALPQLPIWGAPDLSNRILMIQSWDYLQEVKDLLGTMKVPSLLLVVSEAVAKHSGWPEILTTLKASKIFTAILKHAHVPLLKCAISKLFYDAIYSKVQWQLDGRQDGTANVHPTAKVAQQVFIGEHAKIGANAVIHPGAVIGPYASVGAGAVIYPHVTLYPFCLVGEQSRIHAGTVVGGDGFGYEFNGKEHEKIWHFGGVYIGNNVEIGSNCCVDMGTFYPTIIQDGAKIDNQVQVAHNTMVGPHVIICGQAGTAGSSKVGAYSVLGGRVAIGPQVELGAQCQIAGNAMVTKSWPAKSILGGHPARPLEEWMRSQAFIKKLMSKK